MAGLDDTPLPQAPRDAASERHNARVGLWLFALYLAAYVAYVLVNAFRPALMDEVTVGGLNVAVASGAALILGAMALSFVYAFAAKRGPS